MQETSLSDQVEAIFYNHDQLKGLFILNNSKIIEDGRTDRETTKTGKNNTRRAPMFTVISLFLCLNIYFLYFQFVYATFLRILFDFRFKVLRTLLGCITHTQFNIHPSTELDPTQKLVWASSASVPLVVQDPSKLLTLVYICTTTTQCNPTSGVWCIHVTHQNVLDLSQSFG